MFLSQKQNHRYWSLWWEGWRGEVGGERESGFGDHENAGAEVRGNRGVEMGRVGSLAQWCKIWLGILSLK